MVMVDTDPQWSWLIRIPMVMVDTDPQWPGLILIPNGQG